MRARREGMGTHEIALSYRPDEWGRRRTRGELGLSTLELTALLGRVRALIDDRSRIGTIGPRARLALTTARAVSWTSSLWRQRGLGTIFLKLNDVRAFRGTECTVEFAPGCLFRLPVFESYWGPTVIGGRPYEPEVVNVLRSFTDLQPTFIDGGANWGYFSILVTGPEFRYRTALAVEANPSTFARLNDNARVNGERFSCVPFALAARSGERVQMTKAQHHAVAHVQTHATRASADHKTVEVETITIDDAVQRADLFGRDRFVLKLDVEGQEIPAITGAQRLRDEKDHVIVYEDFASTEFRTTAHLMSEGTPVFYVRSDNRCVRVPDHATVLGIIADDGRRSRPVNLVAPKRDGAFYRHLDDWSRR